MVTLIDYDGFAATDLQITGLIQDKRVLRLDYGDNSKVSCHRSCDLMLIH